MSAFETTNVAAATATGSSRRATVITTLVGLAFLAFLYETEPDWFYFTPVAAIFLALTAALFVPTNRWRASALAVMVLFLVINAAARLKFMLVAMNLHVFDVFFHASLTQALFFLQTFPKVAWSAIALLGLSTWALVVAFRFERVTLFRLRSRFLAAGAIWLAAAPATYLLTLYNTDFFNPRRHGLSTFFSSFVDIPQLWRNGALIDVNGAPAPPAALPALSCAPVGKPPHIVLILSESTMPPGVYPGLPFADETKPFFVSDDGEARRLRVETFGGATWLSDFAALTGLSTRDLGALRTFSSLFMTGRVRHSLPGYLKACGYGATMIYPVDGDFGGSERFYRSLGFDDVIDQRVHKAPTDQERDAFYYGQALKALERGVPSGAPQFVTLSTMGTHAPWDFRLDPEAVKPGEKLSWSGDPQYDEYMWRLVLAARDQAAFLKTLETRFPGERFLLATYGDHQPAVDKIPMRNAAQLAGDGKWMEIPPNSKIFETFYSLKGIHYRPVMPSNRTAQGERPILDIPNLAATVIAAAGLPKDEALERRARLIKSCGGLYATCGDRAVVVDFQTWMVAQGWVLPR